MPSSATQPDWNALYEVAAAQDGLFTAAQAAEVGYSHHLLIHHTAAGRLMRLRRGIYRLVHFPAGDDEHLVEAWLWTGCQGVISHTSALALQGLSDALPDRIDLTVPASWRTRRLRVPGGIDLHFSDIAAGDRAWHGAVPVTSPRRTLADCAAAGVSPELVRAAAIQALDRGLVTRAHLLDLAEVAEIAGLKAIT